jgi:class 3 adenylate cyclase
MKLFENYLNGIGSILDNKSGSTIYKSNEARRLILDSYSSFSGDPTLRTFSSEGHVSTLEESSKTILNIDKTELEKYFGKNKLSFPEIKIGKHPDFENLRHNESEKHYCISMFVDIKGSTTLALKHSLEEVRLIKDSLLTLCIHVASFFGGHVHRLQGDAAFIQFVRKGQHPNDSIINSLNAASVLCQFVSNDLSTLFQQKDLNPIKIRVGIDYGSNEKVLWSYYGIPGCNELTTTSLHTDLAAKLQARASINSIRIGRNIVDALDLANDFYYTPTNKIDGIETPDYYILQTPDFRYNQYVFDWEKYLNSFDFITKRGDGTLEIVSKSISLRCYLMNDDDTVLEEYYQNSFSIPKSKSLKFELLRNGITYYKSPQETIVWEAVNRGKQAKDANEENHDFGGKYFNKNYCVANTAYLGHHYLKCTIKRQFLDNVVLKFPIFVQ